MQVTVNFDEIRICFPLNDNICYKPINTIYSIAKRKLYANILFFHTKLEKFVFY